jgi:thioredoxin reductase
MLTSPRASAIASKNDKQKECWSQPMVDTAIVGAGPYGLSIAAHLRLKGIPFRIFGRPMDSWQAHMPKGMLLKSDGFASNIYDPSGEFTLKEFCTERGIAYADLGLPVKLETFSAYGLAFRERLVPELENKLVVEIERLANGFRLRLDTGETLIANRVVLAVGISHFEYVPANLGHLPARHLSHSFSHHDLASFRGRKVAVIGGGSSAIDLAALLHENGAQVELIARKPTLIFHQKQEGREPRSLWERIRRPKSGLGPGLRSRFFSDAPQLFHLLPEAYRLKAVRTHLGPAGGWFAKEKINGRVPLQLGCTIESAQIENGRVRLNLRRKDGTRHEIWADHVIAATGYKVDLEKLTFLSSEIRSAINSVDSTPILSSTFESSVPGLYFVGIAAANSFGPLMRFAYGAAFAARTLSRTLEKTLQAAPALPQPGVDPVSVATAVPVFTRASEPGPINQKTCVQLLDSHK